MQKSAIFAKKYRKVGDHCHYTGNIEVLYIAYVI